MWFMICETLRLGSARITKDSIAVFLSWNGNLIKRHNPCLETLYSRILVEFFLVHLAGHLATVGDLGYRVVQQKYFNFYNVAQCMHTPGNQCKRVYWSIIPGSPNLHLTGKSWPSSATFYIRYVTHVTTWSVYHTTINRRHAQWVYPYPHGGEEYHHDALSMIAICLFNHAPDLSWHLYFI